MKKTFALAALAAVTATLAFAAPASAAPYWSFDNVNARQAQLEQRIDWGQRAGRLTFFEARALRDEMRQINFVEASYRRGGLNGFERADLNRRLDRVDFDLQRELNDRDHRGDGHRDHRGF